MDGIDEKDDDVEVERILSLLRARTRGPPDDRRKHHSHQQPDAQTTHNVKTILKVIVTGIQHMPSSILEDSCKNVAATASSANNDKVDKLFGQPSRRHRTGSPKRHCLEEDTHRIRPRGVPTDHQRQHDLDRDHRYP